MARSKQLASSSPIYGALRSAKGPMTAYQILDVVREQGITAPPTVYRALNRLVEEGLAHRVESINAYVACSHTHDAEEAAIFAICERCGMVDEIEDKDAVSNLRQVAESDRFSVHNLAVEIHGLCGDCRERAETSEPPGERQ